MKIKDVIQHLEELAPLSSQESYDNSGLICGDKNMELTNALISLDCIEEIIDEAIDKKCNLVISHHPILFSGIKSLSGKNYVERTIIKAIKNDIAIYAIHTNLDNYRHGVNKQIGDILAIKNPSILAPSSDNLIKLITYVPLDKSEAVKEALFIAGAGKIGDYAECSFSSEGIGTFKGNDASNPVYGEKNIRSNEKELKIEVIISAHSKHKVVSALLKSHPYEEVAYDLIPLLNENYFEGSGMIGELDEEMSETSFLQLLKDKFKCKVIRHTGFQNKTVKRIAWCGGAGSFLLKQAKRQNADIFISGDFKYHEFFDAENQILIADIGHFESEQFTIELIDSLLRKKIPTFAPYLTEINTNPVKYF